MWSKSLRLIVPRKMTKTSVGVWRTRALARPASTSPSCEIAGPADAAVAAAVAAAALLTFEPTLAPPWDCWLESWKRPPPSPRAAFFACSCLRAPRSSSEAVEVTLATKRAGGKERPMAVMHASALPR